MSTKESQQKLEDGLVGASEVKSYSTFPETPKEIETEEESACLSRRSLIIFKLCVIVFAGAGLSSTMLFATIPSVIVELETTEFLVDMSLIIFHLFLVLSLGWGALSDRFGRKKPMLISLVIFTAGNVACALCWNIYVLIVARALTAVGGSAFIVISTGVISDIVPHKERGSAVGWLTMSIGVGPLVGPAIGGVLSEYFGWRSTFWLLALCGAILFFFTFFLLSETLASIVNPPLDATPAEETDCCTKIFAPFKLLSEPRVLWLSFSNVICTGMALSVLLQLPIILHGRLGFNEQELGLAIIPLGAFALMGSKTGGNVSDFFGELLGHVGGKLVPTLYGCFMYIPSLALFYFATPFWLIEVSLCAIGFFSCLARPGIYNFLLFHYPNNSSGVSGCVFAIESFGKFIISLVGSSLWSHRRTRFIYYTTALSLCLALCLSTAYYILSSWKEARREEKAEIVEVRLEEEDSGVRFSGERGHELVELHELKSSQ